MSLDLTDCSDGELAALSAAGNGAAFTEILKRHREPVYRLIRSHIADADEALDLTQESFVAAFRALRRYDPARSFRAWLASIAINKCRDWARRRAVRRLFRFAAPLEAAADVADDSASSETILANRRELDRVTRAVAALPASLKEPLILRTIDGLSQSEAAAALGLSEKAVEVRLYRARRKLAELLAAS